MRRNLEVVCLVVLVWVFWTTGMALYGPGQLPHQIPMRDDLAPHGQGLGSSAIVLLFPIVAVAIYLLLTVIARFPKTFNYPVAVTAENRPRLEALSLSLLAWMKAEMVCLFAWIQYGILQSARQIHGVFSPISIPIAVGIIFATVLWHIAAMLRVGRTSCKS